MERSGASMTSRSLSQSPLPKSFKRVALDVKDGNTDATAEGPEPIVDLQEIRSRKSELLRENSKLKLSIKEKKKAMSIIGRSYLKSWMSSHGRRVRPPKLHSSVQRVIGAWFELVDDDGSGGLDASELTAALKAAGLPCDDQSILEIVRLMDLNKDGEISWQEFEHFLASEFAAGKALLSGDYVLPNGATLPFGQMVSKMRRNRMIQDIVSGGNTRQRWVSLAADEDLRKQELTMLQKAEEEQAAWRRAVALQRMLDQEREEEEARQAAFREAERAEQERLNILNLQRQQQREKGIAAAAEAAAAQASKDGVVSGDGGADKGPGHEAGDHAAQHVQGATHADPLSSQFGLAAMHGDFRHQSGNIAAMLSGDQEAKEGEGAQGAGRNKRTSITGQHLRILSKRFSGTGEDDSPWNVVDSSAPATNALSELLHTHHPAAAAGHAKQAADSAAFHHVGGQEQSHVTAAHKASGRAAAILAHAPSLRSALSLPGISEAQASEVGAGESHKKEGATDAEAQAPHQPADVVDGATYSTLAVTAEQDSSTAADGAHEKHAKVVILDQGAASDEDEDDGAEPEQGKEEHQRRESEHASSLITLTRSRSIRPGTADYQAILGEAKRRADQVLARLAESQHIRADDGIRPPPPPRITPSPHAYHHLLSQSHHHPSQQQRSLKAVSSVLQSGPPSKQQSYAQLPSPLISAMNYSGSDIGSPGAPGAYPGLGEQGSFSITAAGFTASEGGAGGPTAWLATSGTEPSSHSLTSFDSARELPQAAQPGSVGEAQVYKREVSGLGRTSQLQSYSPLPQVPSLPLSPFPLGMEVLHPLPGPSPLPARPQLSGPINPSIAASLAQVNMMRKLQESSTTLRSRSTSPAPPLLWDNTLLLPLGASPVPGTSYSGAAGPYPGAFPVPNSKGAPAAGLFSPLQGSSFTGPSGWFDPLSPSMLNNLSGKGLDLVRLFEAVSAVEAAELAVEEEEELMQRMSGTGEGAPQLEAGSQEQHVQQSELATQQQGMQAHHHPGQQQQEDQGAPGPQQPVDLPPERSSTAAVLQQAAAALEQELQQQQGGGVATAEHHLRASPNQGLGPSLSLPQLPGAPSQQDGRLRLASLGAGAASRAEAAARARATAGSVFLGGGPASAGAALSQLHHQHQQGLQVAGAAGSRSCTVEEVLALRSRLAGAKGQGTHSNSHHSKVQHPRVDFVPLPTLKALHGSTAAGTYVEPKVRVTGGPSGGRSPEPHTVPILTSLTNSDKGGHFLPITAAAAGKQQASASVPASLDLRVPVTLASLGLGKVPPTFAQQALHGSAAPDQAYLQPHARGPHAVPHNGTAGLIPLQGLNTATGAHVPLTNIPGAMVSEPSSLFLTGGGGKIRKGPASMPAIGGAGVEGRGGGGTFWSPIRGAGLGGERSSGAVAPSVQRASDKALPTRTLVYRQLPPPAAQLVVTTTAVGPTVQR